MILVWPDMPSRLNAQHGELSPHLSFPSAPAPFLIQPMTTLLRDRSQSRRFNNRPILAPTRMRALIDAERLKPYGAATPVAMVIIRDVLLKTADEISHVDGVVKIFNECCRNASPEQVHDYHLGWLGTNTLAILMPYTGASDSTAIAERILSETKLPRHSICLSFSDIDQAQASCEFQRAHLGEARVQLMPWWKRMIDITVAATILFLTLPILAVAALAVRMTSRGPAIFRQMRVGLGGRPFEMFKLRTMQVGAEYDKDKLLEHNERDGGPFKMDHDPRVTWVGTILRRTSIDELPQLFNVLRGDMSMVGPRPLPCDEWVPTEGWYALRHDVTPGLTCFWQVNGRYRNVTFEEWMKMDLDYISQRTMRTDLKLILQTIYTVVCQKGAK